MNVGAIVEGHGEITSVPIVIRRIVGARHPELPVQVPKPFRLPRSEMTIASNLERAVELMARKVGDGGPILIFLDSDDDCPAELGPRLLAMAQTARADREIGVVIVQREFEAWYVASASSLGGYRGLPEVLTPPPNHDQIRDAKGWLSVRMRSGYSPTVDQDKFAARFSLEEARANRSFVRFEQMLLRMAERALATTSG